MTTSSRMMFVFLLHGIICCFSRLLIHFLSILLMVILASTRNYCYWCSFCRYCSWNAKRKQTYGKGTTDLHQFNDYASYLFNFWPDRYYDVWWDFVNMRQCGTLVQWLDCTTDDRKVSGSNPTGTAWKLLAICKCFSEEAQLLGPLPGVYHMCSLSSTSYSTWSIMSTRHWSKKYKGKR